MKQYNRPNLIREAAIRLYRDGYKEAEIIRNKKRLSDTHKLGADWNLISQSSLNRWVKIAKEEDPDLEILHLLSRRRRKPGVYTNWEANGVVILTPYYEPLEDTLYLGIGNDYFPMGDKVPSKIVETDPEWRSKFRNAGTPLRKTDAVGLYLAELKSLGYSLRDIVALWRHGKTRHPDLDRAPRVRWLIRQIRVVQKNPMSHATIGRILQTYSFGSVAESFKESQMAELGDLDD